MLKPVIQDAADRINNKMNNIDAIKNMIIIDRNTREAIRKHLAEKDRITASPSNAKNPIVTMEDIINAMNREIVD